MTDIIQLLTDLENQPHQYVGDPEGLKAALTPPPAASEKDRAAALEAFDEYLATTGLTPMDEQKRRFEKIHKHKATIRRVLMANAGRG